MVVLTAGPTTKACVHVRPCLNCRICLSVFVIAALQVIAVHVFSDGGLLLYHVQTPGLLATRMPIPYLNRAHDVIEPSACKRTACAEPGHSATCIMVCGSLHVVSGRRQRHVLHGNSPKL